MLLTRKDGSEFVAVLIEHDREYPIGRKFAQGGFLKSPDANGRSVYTRSGEVDLPATVLMKNDEGLLEVAEELGSMTPDNISLAGLSLILSYLKQIPLDEARADIVAESKR